MYETCSKLIIKTPERRQEKNLETLSKGSGMSDK